MSKDVVAEASATTCVVGCKLPHGLHLELKGSEGVVRHTLKGNNAARIIGGYGITDGIPTEFMTQWLKKNAKHPAVIAGAIFMHNTVEGAVARAKEGREIRTGCEAIDPIAQAKRFSLNNGPSEERETAEAAYRKQVAENPVRNRQVVE